MPTAPSAKPDLDALPTAPSRSNPSAYRVLMDAFLAALVTFRTQADAVATWMSSTATQVYNNAVEAAAAATSALANANATEWVSGGSYEQGDQVWSPITILTYRAKTTHSGVTTDPSADSTNWTLSVGTGYAPLADPAFTGNPTAPTQTAGNDSTRLATTAFVKAAVDAKGLPLIAQEIVSSAVATVEFNLTGGHSGYRLIAKNVRPESGSTTLQLRFGDDLDFHDGASDYAWRMLSDATASNSTGTNHVRLSGGINNTAGRGGLNLDIQLYPSADGSEWSMVAAQGFTNGSILSIGGQLDTASLEATRIQLFFSAGNIAQGEFYLYPLTE